MDFQIFSTASVRLYKHAAFHRAHSRPWHCSPFFWYNLLKLTRKKSSDTFTSVAADSELQQTDHNLIAAFFSQHKLHDTRAGSPIRMRYYKRVSIKSHWWEQAKDVDRSKSYYANFSLRPAYTPTDDLFSFPGLTLSGGLGGVLRLYDV